MAPAEVLGDAVYQLIKYPELIKLLVITINYNCKQEIEVFGWCDRLRMQIVIVKYGA